MTKFNIEVHYRSSEIFTVEADTWQEAVEKVSEEVDQSEVVGPFGVYYEDWTSVDTWAT